MNLPNKLTILRVCMIPFFVAALLWDEGDSQTMRVIADVIFIAASLTDMLDGKIARKYNLVTNFGNTCFGCTRRATCATGSVALRGIRHGGQ